MASITHRSKAQDLRACGYVYRLLSRLWIRELDEPLVELLTEGALAAAYRAVGGVPPTEAEVRSDPQARRRALTELAADYCQLFVGPSGHLPPCQSVWVAGGFEDWPAAAMRKYLEILDIQEAELDGVMVDHLAVQLRAMAALCELLSWYSSQAERDQEDLAELAQAFFRDHLTWPRDRGLLRAARGRARTPFYRGVIEVTDRFLADQAESWL